MCANVDITPLTEPVQHAEGPIYHMEKDTLYYVDTFKATAYRYELQTGKRFSLKVEGHDSIAIIIPIEGKEDQFIVGADRALYKLNWHGPDASPAFQKQITVEDNKSHNQFNDGKIDRQGRLWLGTLTRNKDLSVAPAGGSLYMFNDLNGCEEKIHNTSISNGMAWSKDGKYFYFVDTAPGQVYRFNYEEKSGQISNREVIFDMQDHPNLKGLPDGLTIDENDNLWIALFGGHSVVNVNPTTKALLRVVRMPATYITSACFGGPNLDTLFVTSSRLHLTEEQLKEEPSAGSVFAVKNLGVRGLKDHHFKIK